MIAGPRVVVLSNGTFVWDSTRSKMLSISRYTFSSGRYSRSVRNEYLRFDDGIPGSVSGKMVRYNATIVSIGGMTETSGSWRLKVFKYGSNTPIINLLISNQAFIFNNLNVDVNAGDVLQFFAEGSNIKMPLVELELAWRG